MTQHSRTPTASGPFRRVSCVTAACSRCGTQDLDDDRGYVPHFDDTEAAVECLTGLGWQMVPGPAGPELLCPACGCAQFGHDRRTSPAVVLDDGTRLSPLTFCDRCGRLLDANHTQPSIGQDTSTGGEAR